MMLRLFEQGPLANSFNFTLGAEGWPGPGPLDPAAGFFANSTVSATKIAIFQCPSDRVNQFQINPGYAGGALSGPIFTKGNYAVSWGNTNWGAQYDNDPLMLTVPAPRRSATMGGSPWPRSPMARATRSSSARSSRGRGMTSAG